MYVFLSHVVDPADRGYPGEPTLEIEPTVRIARGDVYNASIMHLFNHFGSHMDAPKHFNDNGPGIADIPMDRLIYEKVCVLDIPKGQAGQIVRSDLEPHAAALAASDCALIRTGVEALRRTDPEAYAARGASVGVNGAEYLIASFPNLKAIGLDVISLASPSHADEAARAHQTMLGKFSDNYICIIEDLALSVLGDRTPRRVFSLPLRVKGLDGAPVTVVAEVE